MQLEINDTLTIREKQFQCVWISPEPTEVTRKWHNIFQVLKEKNYQHRILHLTKVTCRNSQMKESYENLSLVSQPFSSVQFICSVVSDSLQPHGLQHVRPPCPSPTPWVHSNSCPSSQWCHSTISSSVIPFSSCLQSSQHQSLFQWVSSSHQVAKVLELQLEHQSFQWIFRTCLL